jgi:hypothetical protein
LTENNVNDQRSTAAPSLSVLLDINGFAPVTLDEMIKNNQWFKKQRLLPNTETLKR